MKRETSQDRCIRDLHQRSITSVPLYNENEDIIFLPLGTTVT